ncbi:MAG TPA: CDP-alcohol phosphatidyltransferase family protein, partial [Syntrophorhabdaceae bacterium]|nr:CDP-alcohol phosphatidyltransferase family protein [Syntrophorhabdaceae bacterium]
MTKGDGMRSMNVPNILSIFRFFVTFYFIYAVYQGRMRLALYLFLIQGVSDLLDGFIARVTGSKT